MAQRPDKLASNKISTTTQKYLDISEIKENIVILRDGSMRSVLLVSSINFALKSEDEQSALISAYVSFLNNLDFSLQVVIQSRELDMENYLNDLKRREKEHTNELLKIQMNEHIQYIEDLISIGRIMNKRFYLVVPYNPSSDKRRGFFSSLMDAFRPTTLIRTKEDVFKKKGKKLLARVEQVQSGLNSIGLASVELDTQGLIELYYNTYNPVSSTHEKMKSVEKIRVS